MCGIVGYIGRRPCAPILLEGLAEIEYRGYDSAGIAVVARPGELRVVRREGKLRELEAAIPKRFGGKLGIAHTRWATHGEPSEANAHPQRDASGHVAVVHNGIVENGGELRNELEEAGVEFASETDTEVIAHLIGRALETTDGIRPPLEDAVRSALARIEGTYGLAVIDALQPDAIVVARSGSPVLIGVGEHEHLVASDAAALVRHTQRVVHLEDGELAVVTADGYRTSALAVTATQGRPFDSAWSIDQFDRAGHDHHMHKEIYEQPAALARALSGRLEERFATARLGGIGFDARDVLGIRRVKLLGCGTAYYAALAGANLIEELARIPADAEPASEFRYRDPVIERDVLYIAVSQSGETADTLAAVQEVKRKGGNVIGVVNVVGSAIARECDGIYLHAGPEVSVASTKVFSSMYVCLALLALQLGRVRDLGHAEGTRLLAGLRALPDAVCEILVGEDDAIRIAGELAGASSLFFLGRNRGYPIALEGAQKLKEISYIHAEAYQASELKHGPLALVGPDFPSVVIIPDDALFEKNLSTVQQIRARRGPVFGIGQSRAAQAQEEAGARPLFDELIVVPSVAPELDPLLLTIPLQLIAYHAAVALGRDVDQPRNLAKSVTVE
ncbi:MAG TPA: glutamine--fructose-6-phosphate transaminase (isomerizing) [Gaiellales bacterium]|jgi:glucosamine--fructose-6-phosphate aminotransferase (isomerizing)